MKRLVIDISFALWAIYFFLLIYRETKYNKNEKKTINIWKNVISLIRMDGFFFLIIYLIYIKFAQEVVLPFLYLAIIMTNIVNILYEIFEKNKKEKINQNEIVFYFGGMIIVGILAMYLFISQKYQNVFVITLFLDILVPSFILIFRILKIVKKN